MAFAAVVLLPVGETPKENPIKGYIKFSQKDFDSLTLISGEISGLPPKSKQSLSIYCFGDLFVSSRGIPSNIGGRFNFDNPGLPLCDFEADVDGKAKLSLTLPIKLIGPQSVLARSLVLERGNNPVAFGVIGISES